MPKTMISARISEELDEKLEALAASEKRSKSFIMEEALQLYVAREEWMIARADASLQAAEKSGHWYAHDAVMKAAGAWAAGKTVPALKPKSKS